MGWPVLPPEDPGPVELGPGDISLSVRDGDPLEVDVRGKLVSVGAEPVQVPLQPVVEPEPTVFPSGLPTASIPVVLGNT